MRVNEKRSIGKTGFPPESTPRGVNFNSLNCRNLIFSAFLGLSLALSFGCNAPPPGGGEKGSTAAPEGQPELSDAVINERINDARVREVPEENGKGDPIFWSFDRDEPKEITVVERQENGPRATLVLEIKTRSAPGTRNPRELAGQIRTEWELRTGWVLRRWEIVDTENISMKYRNLARPAEQNNAQ